MNRLQPRTGASGLIPIFVLLLLVSMVLISAFSTGIRHRQQRRRELQLEQTLWLLDAGIGIAVGQVELDGSFEEFEFVPELDRYSGAVSGKLIAESDGRSTVRVTAILKRKKQQSDEEETAEEETAEDENPESVTTRSRNIVLNLGQPGSPSDND